MRIISIMLVLVLAACGSEGDDDDDNGVPDQYMFGGDERPVEIRFPISYDHAQSYPLIIVLHGHSAGGLVQLIYSRIDELVDDPGVLVLAPEGIVASDGHQSWNATDACCHNEDLPDDAAYIRGLIDEVSAVYNVDPKRVYLWGHSNGGFMSYRMACDHADVVAGIVSLAGATWQDASKCDPSEPVSILQIHGTVDDAVPYEGGGLMPSADATMTMWADYNGCAATRATDSQRLDLEANLSGEDTDVERHDDCPAGIDVQLWTIQDGSHIPLLRANFADLMWSWYEAHPKP